MTLFQINFCWSVRKRRLSEKCTIGTLCGDGVEGTEDVVELVLIRE